MVKINLTITREKKNRKVKPQSLRSRLRQRVRQKALSTLKRKKKDKIQVEQGRPPKRKTLTAEERSILDGENPRGTYDSEGNRVNRKKKTD